VRNLTPARLSVALELARLPQSVRGFGHVRHRQAQEVAARRAKVLLEQTMSG